jgi:hypothetical protein
MVASVRLLSEEAVAHLRYGVEDDWHGVVDVRGIRPATELALEQANSLRFRVS